MGEPYAFFLYAPLLVYMERDCNYIAGKYKPIKMIDHFDGHEDLASINQFGGF